MSIRRISTLAACAAFAALVVLALTPVLIASAASNSQNSRLGHATLSVRAAPALVRMSDDCKPDQDNDFDNNAESDNGPGDDQGDNDDRGNNECPPPNVPEAPMALLLPLTAGAVLGGAYLVTRRRARRS